MRPRIVDALKTAIGSDLFSSLVPTGTLMYILAMLVVMWVFVRRSKSVRLSAYHALGASVLAMVGGLLGARIFYLLQHLKHTIAHPEVLFDLSGGTTSWGAYLGGFAGFLFYLRGKKLPVLPYTDVLGACLGLGPFIGRWSCFLNGCCYGSLSTLPWALRFPAHSYPYEAHLQTGLIGSDATLSLSIHPVQIYLSLAGLIIFILASRFWFHFRNRLGATFAFYWFLYGAFRFVIEFFRADSLRLSGLNLTMAQYFCIFIVGIAMFLLIRKFFIFQEKNSVE